MAVSIDLAKAHRHHRHGDLIVILTWVNDSRALVVLPAIRRDAGWFIVDESAAYLWGVDHPDQALRQQAMTHVWRQSEVACWMLGLEPSISNRSRVVSIIVGWIPDLVKMPSAPLPEFTAANAGEIIFSADGQLVREEEIKVEAPGGATYG